jgi:hypothetical protein
MTEMRRLVLRVCPACGRPDNCEDNTDQLCDAVEHPLGPATAPLPYVRLDDAVAMLNAAGHHDAAGLLHDRGHNRRTATA